MVVCFENTLFGYDSWNLGLFFCAFTSTGTVFCSFRVCNPKPTPIPPETNNNPQRPQTCPKLALRRNQPVSKQQNTPPKPRIKPAHATVAATPTAQLDAFAALQPAPGHIVGGIVQALLWQVEGFNVGLVIIPT